MAKIFSIFFSSCKKCLQQKLYKIKLTWEMKRSLTEIEGNKAEN